MLTKNKKKSNTKKPGNKIFTLICEDASHLGGSMGTEYTTLLWTKIFTDKDKAKEYAKKKVGKGRGLYDDDEDRWQKNGRELCWDSGPYIFTIKEEKIL